MTERKGRFDFHDRETYFNNWLAGETKPSTTGLVDEPMDASRDMGMEKRLDSILFALHMKEKVLRFRSQGAK
jgi:hypothetical protein